ncbi:MAG: allantoinase PuuE [Hyphomicrobiales bacterium]|nr:allantoinase PuuE [Hyphomicrobiales bacterium]MDE2016804.1 allantoinase PuuE [Hyphomicrobiales bacterium]
MAEAPYPRDMAGYGRRPPFADWPGGARVAVQFVINYEEGGENNVLHGDAASEAFLSEIVGAQPWPGQRHHNMESIYEYGSRAGFWRLHRIFTERAAPVTVYAVATAMARVPDVVASWNEAGWDVATHGLKWIEYKDAPYETERAQLDEAVRIHAACAGKRPLGFYQGRASMNTLRIGMEEQGFLYLSDSYADDLPYWLEGERGPQLIVPYTLDANDMRFATPQGFNSGDQFFSYLKDSFDVLYAEGADRPKMMSVGLHCRLAGRPGRAAAVARFVDYVKAHDAAWIATRIDIARHWIRRHPPAGGYGPSHMPRALFVELYGDVYEHTPAVAEAAHRVGLGTECDRVDGLAAAMAKAAATLTTDAKLALVRAHPDLAGKFAAARRLTADSAKEQAGAGLDALTDEERARFTRLNADYVARFGFPFVIAVRGRTKSDVLAAFEARLENGREAELAEALAQIDRIAALRLKDRLG